MFKVTPNPPETDPPSPHKPPKYTGQLFSVCPDVNTEALLANASEDLLSISAIATDLADHVQGPSRCVALALSRMADGVYLLVDQALDHLDEPEMAAIIARQQLRAD